MKNYYILALCLVCLGAVINIEAGEAESLDARLEPLRPWIGATWRGEFKNSTPEKPVVDMARWERALNGKAVRILHSINDGVYGGESILMWDEKKSDLRFLIDCRPPAVVNGVRCHLVIFLSNSQSSPCSSAVWSAGGFRMLTFFRETSWRHWKE